MPETVYSNKNRTTQHKGRDKKEYILPLNREDDPDIRLQGHLKEGIWKVVLEPEGRTHMQSKSSRFVPVIGRDFDRSR